MLHHFCIMLDYVYVLRYLYIASKRSARHSPWVFLKLCSPHYIDAFHMQTTTKGSGSVKNSGKDSVENAENEVGY